MIFGFGFLKAMLGVYWEGNSSGSHPSVRLISKSARGELSTSLGPSGPQDQRAPSSRVLPHWASFSFSPNSLIIEMQQNLPQQVIHTTTVRMVDPKTDREWPNSHIDAKSGTSYLAKYRQSGFAVPGEWNASPNAACKNLGICLILPPPFWWQQVATDISLTQTKAS